MGLFTRDPRRPVAVVDERTYRQAVRTVGELLATGDGSDLVKAHFAITAILGWLRYEIRTGRRSRRVNRARRLEQWEAHCDEVRRALGLPLKPDLRMAVRRRAYRIDRRGLTERGTSMSETRLECLSAAAAQAVADAAGGLEPNHRARADGSAVILTYFDKRYPLNAAEWAFEHGHADDDSAAAVIARL